CDGRTALNALETNDFDVMLLDIHMPELDGFHVVAVQRQRELGTSRRLPIIALTARSAPGERERCLQAGMDDYLVKPVRPSELFAAIDRGVGARSQGSVVRSQESGVRNQESGSGSQKSPGDLTPDSCLLTPGTNDLLDPAALLAACDGDAELLR